MRSSIPAAVYALGAVLSLTPLPAAAQQAINLTVAAGQPLRAVPPLNMVSTFFIPEVNKRIAAAGLDKKYKINWREAYAGSLLKPTMVLEGTRDGITDIGFEPTIFHPDRLPLEQISFMAPFVTSDAELVGRVMNRLHAEIPEFRQQYDKFGVVRLGGVSNDTFALFTTFPVTKFEDIKGRRITAAGAALQWLRGTPATPVQSNMTLYYNNTKTGVVDGFIIFLSSIPGMKYPEAAPYVTDVGFGAHYASALIMNKKVYEGLPEEIRKILDETGQAWTAVANKLQLEAGNKAFASVKDYPKGTTHDLSREEQVKWANAMPNVAQEWAQRLDKQGLPGTRALAMYMEEMRKAGVKPVRDWDKK